MGIMDILNPEPYSDKTVKSRKRPKLPMYCKCGGLITVGSTAEGIAVCKKCGKKYRG